MPKLNTKLAIAPRTKSSCRTARMEMGRRTQKNISIIGPTTQRPLLPVLRRSPQVLAMKLNREVSARDHRCEGPGEAFLRTARIKVKLGQTRLPPQIIRAYTSASESALHRLNDKYHAAITQAPPVPGILSARTRYVNAKTSPACEVVNPLGTPLCAKPKAVDNRSVTGLVISFFSLVCGAIESWLVQPQFESLFFDALRVRSKNTFEAAKSVGRGWFAIVPGGHMHWRMFRAAATVLTYTAQFLPSSLAPEWRGEHSTLALSIRD
ncbi:hypothetical protein K438DRAFT_2118381 [Mycena galopus ATCC 62051]|nr:hypothetical protein K438DRAFT_2118381 [Mycena galopus ATCC 62051]